MRPVKFKRIIVVAGGTGKLGERVMNALLEKDIEVRALCITLK
jgi:uncharacterized protein YbjT (DUF2867 family)